MARDVCFCASCGGRNGIQLTFWNLGLQLSLSGDLTKVKSAAWHVPLAQAVQMNRLRGVLTARANRVIIRGSLLTRNTEWALYDHQPFPHRLCISTRGDYRFARLGAGMGVCLPR